MTLPAFDLNNTSTADGYNDLEERRKTNVKAVECLKKAVNDSNEKSEVYYEEQLKELDIIRKNHETVLHELYFCNEITPEIYAKIDQDFASLVSSTRAAIKSKVDELRATNPKDEMNYCLNELEIVEAYIEKVKNSDGEEPFNVVKKKLRILEDLEINFTALFKRAISSSVKKNDQEQLTELKRNFMSRYDDALSYLEKMMEEIDEKQRSTRNDRRQTNGNNDGDGSSGDFSSQIKLPKPTLPVFDGSLDKWLHFYDTFDRLVHRHEKIPKIQKFNLLTEHFKPPERDHVLTEFAVREDLYDAAWQAVQKRYNNERVLRTHYLNGFSSVKPMSGQSAKEINRIRDSFSAIVTNLSTMKMTWDQFVVHTVEKSLDEKTLDEWMDTLNDEIPTWDKLKSFLDSKSTRLSTASSLSFGVKKSNSTSNPHSSQQNRYDQKPKKVYAVTSSSDSVCVVCNGGHRVYECDTFREKMSRVARLAVIKKHNLCFNCLCSGHSLRSCPSKSTCRICLKRNKIAHHHTLLHIDGAEFTNNTSGSENSKFESNAHSRAPHPSSGHQFNRFENSSSHQTSTVNAVNSNPSQQSISQIFHRYSNVENNGGMSNTVSSTPIQPKFVKPISVQYPKNDRNNSNGFCGVIISQDYDVCEIDPTCTTEKSAIHYVGGNCNSASTHSTVSNKSVRPTLLSTAQVHMNAQDGTVYACRSLLDTGSNTNFMTEAVAKALGCKLTRAPSSIETVGENTTTSKFTTIATLKSAYGDFTADLHFKVLPSITSNIPSRLMDKSKMEIPDDIFLADPEFNVPKPVDLLLACDVFFFTFLGNPMHLNSGAILIETMFGWVVGGLGPSYIVETTTTNNHTHSIKLKGTGLSSMSMHVSSQFEQLHRQVEEFMQIENIGITENSKNLSPEESQCEKLYAETTYRDDDGRYVVRLPLKPNVTELESNFGKAFQRLRSLDSRRKSDPKFSQAYEKYVQDMIDDGIISKVSPLEKNKGFYLPHHGVLKDSSTTTKIRPVLDGSCTSSSGLSLNNCLMVGPTVQPESFDIFIRFGQGKIGLKCDLEKMFLRILVAPEHRQYQKILWSPVPDGPIEHYQFNSVTFGLACSPNLATRTVQQIAFDHQNDFPQASDIIENSFYVDDGLFSVDSETQAMQLKNEIVKIFSSAHMNARKWSSNDSSMLTNMSAEDIEQPDENDCIKVLGHIWNVKTDTLSIAMKKIDNSKITKSSVLSIIASFYDIRGFFGPVILTAKLFLRELTETNLKWDESPDDKFKNEWIKFCDELEYLKLIQIPRHFIIENAVSIQLHGFGDASEKGYGMIIYLRSMDANGNIQVSLICTKTRLAPTKKKQTLARLELCAAVLLATVNDRFSSILTINVEDATLWSDSMIILHWIKNLPSRYQTYVANRIAKVQEHTKSATWKHVPGQLNPADLTSRGLRPSEIANCSHYWHGSFLSKPEVGWPESKLIVVNEADDDNLLKEVRKVHVAREEDNHIFNCIEKFSRFKCLIHVFVRIFRWRRIVQFRKPNPNFNHRMRLRTRNESQRLTFDSIVTSDEMENALIAIIRIQQKTVFPREYKLLMENCDEGTIFTLPKNSKLTLHTPFFDTQLKILRSGGRTEHCEFISYDTKFPMILPDTQFARTLFHHLHKKHNHPPQLSLRSFARQRFRALHDTQIAHTVTRNCLKCFRETAKPGSQLMAPLPYARVNACTPFEKTAVDFSGYYEIYASMTHTGSKIKVYVAMFKCMVTGAIHLECATSLSAEAFIDVLDRFIARRSCPREIYCDNATNFTAADRLLREAWESQFDHLAEYFHEKGIEFHNTTARASHAGGIYESGIKNYKHYLYRAMGDEAYDYASFTTLLHKIEADLNSRPLINLSNDPNDIQVLTPAHFLVGKPMNARPELPLMPGSEKLRQVHDRVQRARQHFWNEWYMHYLSQLQTRPVDFRTHFEYKVGQAVLLVDKNIPPRKWKIGSIVQVFPGKDKVIRNVKVRLMDNKTEYERHVRYIVLLPGEEA